MTRRTGKRRKEKTVRQKKRRPPGVRRLYAVLAVIVLLVTGLYGYHIISLELERRQVQAENEALKKEKEKLAAELRNVSNPEYIEQQARTQLRMIFPGETLFVLPVNGKGNGSGPEEEGGEGKNDPKKETEEAP